ncbi:MAG: phosphoribosylglycinamide formyltransferase [Rhodobacteraceae bacterium]|nr:phosphoribosylglycinamide formyltransferase [Paracoccaceae bacterium]
MKHNIAVLLSGNGSNLKAMINNSINVCFVVSNNPNALGLKIAKNENIPAYCWQNILELEEEVLKLILKYDVKLLVLAGYMRLLSKKFVNSLPSKFIVNIHPSLLPKYKGMNAIQQAIDDCAEYTGVTVHYVDEGMDSGFIIKQESIKINENDTVKTLKNRLQVLEHRLYSDTIKYILIKN